MKITKSQLKQIIEEELESVVQEGPENDKLVKQIISSYRKMQEGALELQRMFAVGTPIFNLVQAGKVDRGVWAAAFKKIQQLYRFDINDQAELNNALIDELKK